MSGALLGCALGAVAGILLIPTAPDVRRFRRRQAVRLRFADLDRDLSTVIAAALIGAVSALLSGRIALIPPVALLWAGVGAVVVAYLRRSRRQALEREVLEHLPVVIEMLALAVSAGEAPASALARISGEGRGLLLRTVRGAVSDLTLGSTLIQALMQLRHKLPFAEIDRLVDAIALGQQRGTPLTEVLHAQVMDARERQRRTLIESAAGAEVKMMIPVVFLIMPITIIFALYPSFYGMTWI